MRILIAAALISFAAIPTLACDDGSDALTVEEYFSQLEDIEADAERRGDELPDPYEEGAALDERTQGIRDGLPAFEAIYNDYKDGLDGLEPPDELEELHSDYRVATEEFFTEITKYLEGLADATTEAAWEEASNSTLGDAEIERVGEVCHELEDEAASNDIDVDLRCSGD